MKICERAMNFVFVDNPEGNVGVCSWTEDGHSVGNLMENPLNEIYNNAAANEVRQRHIRGDYSKCFVDGCPYLAMNEMDKHLVEYKKQEYPEWLSMAFEHCCNYDCRCCGIKKTNGKAYKDLEEKYDNLVEKLEKILPHIKRIYSNGCGELFLSKRSMRLLQEWKPENPQEAEVYLETNGSLFNENNWKNIDNVGRFNLTVAITVMSFHEDVFQFLSGTTIPISQVENNLRFVKSLREKGIVNRFEIATVVQEQNFREMPEFCKRCIEEFGADYVRLRPYQAWGDESKEQAWITDIRNPEHPYNEEYKKIMSHPILSHPKVHDWSGGIGTVLPVRFPYKDEFFKERIIVDIVLNIEKIAEKVVELNEKLYIYGLGYVGKVLIKELTDQAIRIEGIIDRNPLDDVFLDIPIKNVDYLTNIQEKVMVIVTPIVRTKNIFEILNCNRNIKAVSIKSFLSDRNLYEEVENL